jgi:formylglycine-generating enzyme required for sulfatase activity
MIWSDRVFLGGFLKALFMGYSIYLLCRWYLTFWAVKIMRSKSMITKFQLIPLLLLFVFFVQCHNPTNSNDKSNNANLAEIKVSIGVLNPSFSSDIFEYKIDVNNEVDKIVIYGKPVDKKAVMSKNNGCQQNLIVGINIIVLSVVAEDGLTQNDYKIFVTRNGVSNADLSELQISCGLLTPDFKPDCFEYSVSIPNETQSIIVTGVPSDHNALISGNNGVEQNINIGENRIVISVTAQDGITIKNYLINVYRQANANLQSLSVSSGLLIPQFSPEIIEYNVYLPNNNEEITITGVLADENATITENNGLPIQLNIGLNNIEIIVTGIDALTTKKYKIVVNRRSFDLNMVLIPSGIFQRDEDTNNISSVTSFLMSDKEITRSQFQEIMGVDPSDSNHSSGVNDPVQCVSWYDAVSFCNKLSISEGLIPVYYFSGIDINKLTYNEIPRTNDLIWNDIKVNWNANGYRLPTEMEWMWAAMGASYDRSNGYTGEGINRTGYLKGYAGSTEVYGTQMLLGDFAWYKVNSGSITRPVGTAGVNGSPNEVGLYDMSGNVWDWCWDWYASFPSGVVFDYHGGYAYTWRIIKGGGCNATPDNCAIAIRGATSPHENVGYSVGIRIVRR